MVVEELMAGAFKEEDVVFFSIAEPGAMGSPGEIRFFVKDRNVIKILEGNYVYGKLDLDSIIAYFTPIQGLRLGIGGAKNICAGWNYFYLGYGNNLFMREEYYDDFCHLCKGLNRGEVYGRWQEFAENIVA